MLIDENIFYQQMKMLNVSRDQIHNLLVDYIESSAFCHPEISEDLNLHIAIRKDNGTVGIVLCDDEYLNSERFLSQKELDLIDFYKVIRSLCH